MSDFISTVNLPAIRRSSKAFSYISSLLDRFLRRGMDILVAFWGLLFLSPIFGFIAIAIRRDSPGPVFFRGTRIGLNGRIFKILKFRTMYERPESYQGAKLTISGDDRVTPLGHWLRDTKINELPQLWNVLVGDMSLVGPRPEDPDLATEWPGNIRTEILSVRPGITSPASVIYRDEEDLLTGIECEDDYLSNILPSKLRLDVLYVRNRSILTDLDIIFLTGVALLPVFRKKSIPGRLLYNGPLKQFMTRFMNWFTIDFIIALLSVWVAGVVYRTFGPINVGWAESLLVSLGMGLFFSLINLLLGLNRIAWSKAPAVSAIDLVLSAGLSVGLMLAIHPYFKTIEQFPHGIFILSGIFAATGFIGMRYRERLITGFMNRWLLVRSTAKAVGERVLIVGAGEMGEFAMWFFTRSDFSRAFHVVGFVDDDPRLRNMEIAGRTVVGSSNEIPDLVRKYDVGLAVFAINQIDDAQRSQIVEICEGTRTRLVMFPDLMGIVRNCIEDAAVSPAKDFSPSHIPGNQKQLPRMDTWLDSLDQAIDRGDIGEAREMINQMKSAHLNGD